MARPKVNIAIGICTGGTVRAETVASLVSNIINLAQDGTPAGLLLQIGGYVDVNRNKIAETAINAGVTHLMFIDADMIFPDDGVARLLKLDKDIVGANYNIRLDPTSGELSGPTAKMLVNGKPVSMTSKNFPTKLFKAHAIATGFMMIKTEVFKNLEKPYFTAYQEPSGKHHTEDIDFCEKAGRAGFDIWCEPSLKLGHIGTYTY